jgi:hypothetical protein
MIAALAMVSSAGGMWWLFADKGVAADIQKLADLAAKPDDPAFKEQAVAIAKRYSDRRPLMKVFTERTRQGGLGVGKKVGAIQPDGIEAMVQALVKKARSAAELGEEGDALVRMTQVMIAVAEVMKHKCEVTKRVGHLDPSDWTRWFQDMEQSSLKLAEAVKAKDGAQVKAAATRLQSSCIRCHRIFQE